MRWGNTVKSKKWGSPIRNSRSLLLKLVHATFRFLGSDINIILPSYSYFDGKWHEYESTPLLVAIETGQVDTVKLVLQFGAKLKMTIRTLNDGEQMVETVASRRHNNHSMKNTLQNNSKNCYTLKELSRFAIRHQIIHTAKKYHLINELKLPTTLIEFIKFNQ